MGRDGVFSGPLNGRFYRVVSPLGKGTSLVEGALENAWRSGAGDGLPFVRRFCRGTVPHDGDLGEDQTALAYNDDGTGVWRLWLREESRVAGKTAVEERASALAIADDPDTPLLSLQPPDRKEWLDRARRELLLVAVPRIRVVPLIMTDSWLWIGRKTASADRTYVHLLRSVVGELELDPMLWDPVLSGWTACSYATLLAFANSTGVDLAPDVFLSEVELKGRSLQLKATDISEVRAVLSQIAKTSSETAVKRMSFEVHKDGAAIFLDVDADGLYRGAPARSAGGLPQERISRRFSDVRYAAGRVRQVMQGFVDKIEAESDG